MSATRAPHAAAALQVAGTVDEIPPERFDQLGVEVQRAAYAVVRRTY